MGDLRSRLPTVHNQGMPGSRRASMPASGASGAHPALQIQRHCAACAALLSMSWCLMSKTYPGASHSYPCLNNVAPRNCLLQQHGGSVVQHYNGRHGVKQTSCRTRFSTIWLAGCWLPRQAHPQEVASAFRDGALEPPGVQVHLLRQDGLPDLHRCTAQVRAHTQSSCQHPMT